MIGTKSSNCSIRVLLSTINIILSNLINNIIKKAPPIKMEERTDLQ